MSLLRRLLAVAAGSLAVSSCDANPYEGVFRYRLSFLVTVDGAVKSASSVIEVRYWGNPKSGPSPSAVTTFSEWKGIAPVLDLGSNGWLIAAMMENNGLFERLKSPNPPRCKESTNAAGFPGAFGKTPSELRSLTEGRAKLTERLYPAFIWVPANASYRKARPVCPDEFSSVIGRDIRLQSVTIEVAKDAPLMTLQPFKAAWLDEIRAEQGERYSGGPDFKIRRQLQIETDTIKQKAAKP